MLLQGLAPRPSLAELPANLLQQLDSAAAAARPGQKQPEGRWVEDSMRRAGCATDVRPAAAALKWPFRFGGYLQPPETPGGPNQAAGPRPDQATLSVQPDQPPPSFEPDQATLSFQPDLATTSYRPSSSEPDQTPQLRGRLQREATPFYTPAADIRCFFSDPVSTPLGMTPQAQSASQHCLSRPPFAPTAVRDLTIYHGHSAAASPEQHVAGCSQESAPVLRSSEQVDRAAAGRPEQMHLSAASLSEASAQQEDAIWQPNGSGLSQGQATGKSPLHLSAAHMSEHLSPCQGEAELGGVSSDGGLRSVHGPRLATPAPASRSASRRESVGSCAAATPAAALRRHLHDMALAAHSAYPTVHSVHPNEPEQAAHSTNDIATAQQNDNRSAAPDCSLPKVGQDRWRTPEGKDSASAAQPQFAAVVGSRESPPAEESVGVARSGGGQESSHAAVTPVESNAEPWTDLQPALAPASAWDDERQQPPMGSLHRHSPPRSPDSSLPQRGSSPGPPRSGVVRSAAAEKCMSAEVHEKECNVGVAEQSVAEGYGAAEALAVRGARRLLCLRVLTAWLRYVDNRRERW